MTISAARLRRAAVIVVFAAFVACAPPPPAAAQRGPAGPTAAAGPALSVAEQKALEAMDAEVVAECLEVARQLDGWRKAVEEYRRVLRDAKTKVDDLTATGPA